MKLCFGCRNYYFTVRPHKSRHHKITFENLVQLIKGLSVNELIGDFERQNERFLL